MARKFSHSDVDAFFDHSLDMKTRTIYMGSADGLEDDNDDDGSGTDFRMAERLIKGLHLLEADNINPITIIMNNGGGSEYHGMAIYDAIKGCRSEVTIKVYGLAMSMGSLILQAGDQRIMAPHSRFMIHYGNWGTQDHPKSTYKHSEEGKRWDSIMENIYIDRMLEKDQEMIALNDYSYLEKQLADLINKYNKMTSITRKKTIKLHFSADPAKRRLDLQEALEHLLNFDSYLTPDETVALGLADKVDY